MTDIPEDVMKAAREAMGAVPGAPEFIIYERCARAILAERERCAKVAEAAEMRSLAHGNMVPIMGRSIIAANILGDPRIGVSLPSQPETSPAPQPDAPRQHD